MPGQPGGPILGMSPRHDIPASAVLWLNFESVLATAAIDAGECWASVAKQPQAPQGRLGNRSGSLNILTLPLMR